MTHNYYTTPRRFDRSAGDALEDLQQRFVALESKIDELRKFLTPSLAPPAASATTSRADFASWYNNALATVYANRERQRLAALRHPRFETAGGAAETTVELTGLDPTAVYAARNAQRLAALSAHRQSDFVRSD